MSGSIPKEFITEIIDMTDIVSPVSPSLMAVEPTPGASAPDEASLANDGPRPTMATEGDGDGAPATASMATNAPLYAEDSSNDAISNAAVQDGNKKTSLKLYLSFKSSIHFLFQL